MEAKNKAEIEAYREKGKEEVLEEEKIIRVQGEERSARLMQDIKSMQTKSAKRLFV